MEGWNIRWRQQSLVSVGWRQPKWNETKTHENYANKKRIVSYLCGVSRHSRRVCFFSDFVLKLLSTRGARDETRRDETRNSTWSLYFWRDVNTSTYNGKTHDYSNVLPNVFTDPISGNVWLMVRARLSVMFDAGIFSKGKSQSERRIRGVRTLWALCSSTNQALVDLSVSATHWWLSHQSN